MPAIAPSFCEFIQMLRSRQAKSGLAMAQPVDTVVAVPDRACLDCEACIKKSWQWHPSIWLLSRYRDTFAECQVSAMSPKQLSTIALTLQYVSMASHVLVMTMQYLLQQLNVLQCRFKAMCPVCLQMLHVLQDWLAMGCTEVHRATTVD